MQASGERLPWLTDEVAPRPTSEPRVSPLPAVPTNTGRVMWPWYLLLLLLIGLVGLGAWYLNTGQKEAPPPELPAEEAVPIPVNRPAEAPDMVAPGEPSDLIVPPAETSATELPRSTPVRQRRPQAIGDATQPANTAEPGVREVGRSVFPADEPVLAPPPLAGPSPLVTGVGPNNRGRVVQLGAFPTRNQAELAWRTVTKRYPYLASKPKMVNTVDVRGLGGGRRTRMYRLQLGTSSQAQAVVICQQLERAGQSCVVVY